MQPDHGSLWRYLRDELHLARSLGELRSGRISYA
jgi:hypothetical protein